LIDLRYHVYSLAAVFFALLIGIVVGRSFLAGSPSSQRMLSLAERYSRDLAALQKEMQKQQEALRQSRAELARSDIACEALIPAALGNKLQYRNVAIIQTGSYDDLTAHIRTLIESASGQVTSVTTLSPSFDPEDQATLAAAARLGASRGPGETDRDLIFRTIAESVVDARHSERMSVLEKAGVLTTSGDYYRWNRCVVLVGGSAATDDDRAQLVDYPLIQQLAAAGAVVVGCEPSTAKTSYVPAWSRRNIATVDNADRPPGHVALICLLGGCETANYGQKRTANRLLPANLSGSP
jgi:hypothetical protein